MDYKIKDYYKMVTSDNGKQRKVFNYETIWKDGAFIDLVISDRGRGKTVQAKYLARKLWDEEKLKTLWVMNTGAQIKNDKREFLTDPKDVLDNYTGEEVIRGDDVYTSKDGEAFIKFLPLSQAEGRKGSRPRVGLIVFDEFNVNYQYIKGNVQDALSSIIITTTDPVNINRSVRKIIIHGNNKSMNHPLLLESKIFRLTGEITTKNDSTGRPLMKIISPVFTEKEKQEIRETNKDSPSFQLMEMWGRSDHNYFNESLLDSIMNIMPDFTKYRMYDRVRYIQIGTDRYTIRGFDYGTRRVNYAVQLVKKKVKGVKTWLTLSSTDVSENTRYSLQLKQRYRKRLGSGLLWFDSSYTRENFLKVIRK